MMKAKKVFETLKEQEYHEDEEMLISEKPFDDEEGYDDEDEDLIMQDEFEAALRNELNVPEFSRRTVSFRVKGKPEIIDAVPMAKLKDGSYLMRVGDKYKKFDINDIVEESFKGKRRV